MPDTSGGMVLSDLSLARRIEAADAAVGLQSAEIHARLHPDEGAASETVAGGVAVFISVGSPLTQAIGAGMKGPVRESEMNRLERFFTVRGSPVQIEVCPFADQSLIEEVQARGYRLREFTNVLVRRIRIIETPPSSTSSISVQLSSPDEAELWARTVTIGFGEQLAQATDNLAVLRDLALLPTTKPVLAWVEGRPAGGGALSIHEGVAAIYGASTVPSFRRLGVQSAIVRALITYARESECDIAYTLTRPGSVSQRNVERQGFRVAYTRCSMVLPRGSGHGE